MSLEAFYFVSQIVAAAAVVGSLIFVGLQTRRQAIETRISTNSRLLEEYRAFAVRSVEDKALAEAYENGFAGGFEAIRREDRQRYAVMISCGLRILEQAFVLHESGRLDPRAWASIQLALAPVSLSKAGRQYWTIRRNAFFGPFQKFMDSIQSEPGLVDHFHEFLESPEATLAKLATEERAAIPSGA